LVYAAGDGFQERVAMTLPFIAHRSVAVPSLGLAGALLSLGLGPGRRARGGDDG